MVSYSPYRHIFSIPFIVYLILQSILSPYTNKFSIAICNSKILTIDYT